MVADQLRRATSGNGIVDCGHVRNSRQVLAEELSVLLSHQRPRAIVGVRLPLRTARVVYIARWCTRFGQASLATVEPSRHLPSAWSTQPLNAELAGEAVRGQLMHRAVDTLG